MSQCTNKYVGACCGSAGIFIVDDIMMMYVQMCAIIRGERGCAAACYGIGMRQAAALLLVQDRVIEYLCTVEIESLCTLEIE